MSLLGAGAGAAQGLDDYLQQQLLEQKFKQAQLEHTDDMTLKGRQLSSQEDTAKSEAALRAAQTQDILDKRAEAERQREARSKLVTGATTQQERDFAAGEDAGVKYPFELITQPNGPQREAPTGSIEKDASGFLHRIAPDNSDTPILGADGKPFKGYQAPQQPVVVQTNQGPQLTDRGNGTAKPIIGADGKPVQGPDPASLRSQTVNKQSGIDSVSRLSDDIDQAEKSGLIGPVSGRLYDSLAKFGTTGNKDTDKLIGRLKGDILLTKMHVDAGIGGTRAAASPLLLQKWEDLAMKSSPDLIKGYLSGIHDDMASGMPSTPGAAPAASSDPYQDYLNRTK